MTNFLLRIIYLNLLSINYIDLRYILSAICHYITVYILRTWVLFNKIFSASIVQHYRFKNKKKKKSILDTSII